MADLNVIADLARRNLTIGEWTSPKGEKHVSITRTSGYRKNIAIPVSIVPQLIEALKDKVDELNGI